MLASVYSKDFARSDADFSVYINPDLPNFSEHVKKITSLSYELQQIIIDDFTSDLSLFFELFRYNKSYQQTTMSVYFDSFAAASCFTNPLNRKFGGKQLRQIVLGDIAYPGERLMEYIQLPFKLIEFDDKETEIKITPIGQPSSVFYLVDNRALHFHKGSEEIRFNLVRTKINFNLIVENAEGLLECYPIGGELIDVSIPLDHSLKQFFSAVHKNVVDYQLEFNGSILQFKSYTLSALAHDLERMLFYGDSLPWDQGKYVKRVNRLMYLYFVDLNLRDLKHIERINYLQAILNNVLYPLQYIASFNIPNISSSITSILSKTSDYMFSTLLKKLNSILATQSQTFEFKEFIGMCIANVLNFLVVAKNSDDFQKTYGQIKESDIYKGDIKYSLF